MNYFRSLAAILILSFTFTVSAHPQSTIGTWQSLGPTNFSDQTFSVAYKPDDPSIVLSVSGNDGDLWRSTDGGGHWSVPATAPTGILTPARFDPNNPNTVYVGVPYYIGKSTDAGATWSYIPAFVQSVVVFQYYTDLAISKANSLHMYVVGGSAVGQTTDGGATWTVVPLLSNCNSIVMRNDVSTDYVFLACTTGTTTVIYRNTDAAGTGNWESVLSESGMGTTLLAVAPSNPNVVYTLSQESDSNSPYFGGLHALFRSTNGGAANSWVAMARGNSTNKLSASILSEVFSNYAVECGTGSTDVFRGGGSVVLAVDPKDENRVWAGSIDLFRSDDGGSNFGLASFPYAGSTTPQFLPVFPRALSFHPQFDGSMNSVMLAATAQGIFQTAGARQSTAAGTTAPCNPTNSNVTWSESDTGYINAPFWAGAYRKDGSYLGSSSRGLVTSSDGTGGVWNVINTTVVPSSIAITDQDNNLIYGVNYTKSGQLQVVRSADGGHNFQDITGPITQLFYNSPIVVDPSNKQIVYVGGQALWRSIDGGSSWTKASADFAGSITQIAISALNPAHLLVGTQNLGVASIGDARNSQSSTAPTLVSLTSPSPLSSLTIDPHNDSKAFATFEDYYGQNALYVTADGGATWSSPTENNSSYTYSGLATSFALDPVLPGYLYLGSRYGLFYSTDNGTTWHQDAAAPLTLIASMFPRVIANQRYLVTFTVGHGAYKVSLTELHASVTRPSRMSRATSVTSVSAAPSPGIVSAAPAADSQPISRAEKTVTTDPHVAPLLQYNQLLLVKSITSRGDEERQNKSSIRGRSGAQTIAATLDGRPVGMNQSINLQTALALGSHAFMVGATDNLNQSETLVNSGSIVEDVDQFTIPGQIKVEGDSLRSTVNTAAATRAGRSCTAAANQYQSFINKVVEQSGKNTDPAATNIMIQDAQYLIEHCPRLQRVGSVGK